MKQYQATLGGFQTSSMTIPPDPNNCDYQRMLAEVAAGAAEILPPVAPPNPPTDEEDIAAWIAANKWLGALITALNRPVGHVKAFPVASNLTANQIAAILKANK